MGASSSKLGSLISVLSTKLVISSARIDSECGETGLVEEVEGCAVSGTGEDSAFFDLVGNFSVFFFFFGEDFGDAFLNIRKVEVLDLYCTRFIKIIEPQTLIGY